MDIPIMEKSPDYDIVWIPVSTPAPMRQYHWVRTRSGVIATGHFHGLWSVDGFRVMGVSDEITHWAEIEYPQGPRIR